MDGQPVSPPGTPSNSAGDLAAAALKAAQQAVANLKSDAGVASSPALSDDSGDDALKAAQAAIAAAKLVSEASPPPSASPRAAPPMSSQPTQPMQMPEFSAAPAQKAPEGIDLLADVNLNVKIELGRTRMLVEDVLRLGTGSVVELDKLAGDPVDVYVNDRHVARGEVLVLNDNFCVRINEIVANVHEVNKAR